MLEKNVKKQERKNRSTWVGYHTRLTPTRKEKEEKFLKKYKKDLTKEF